MISTWLNRSKRLNTKYSFNVIDMSESITIDDCIKNYLGDQTLEQYRGKSYLKKYFAKESYQKLIDYLKNNTFPNIDRFNDVNKDKPTKNVRQGDFGEILMTLIVENFTNFKVPIAKLRYKFNNDRSVFCTDLISHNQGNAITSLIYYEIKTRITKDNRIVQKAYEGLLRDEKKPTEGIADFLSRHYHELAEEFENNGHDGSTYYALADKFNDIVKNPSRYQRAFEIVLIIQKDKYEEKVLETLNSISLQLSPLEVTIILIDDLNHLVEETYNKAIDVAVNYVFGNSISINSPPIVV